MMELVSTFSASTFTATLSALKVYLFWTTAHWAAVQVHQEYCAPRTFTGYLFTPLLSQAPHCKITTWVQRTSTDAFNAMTAIGMTWASSFVNSWMSFKTHLKKA